MAEKKSDKEKESKLNNNDNNKDENSDDDTFKGLFYEYFGGLFDDDIDKYFEKLNKSAFNNIDTFMKLENEKYIKQIIGIKENDIKIYIEKYKELQKDRNKIIEYLNNLKLSRYKIIFDAFGVYTFTQFCNKFNDINTLNKIINNLNDAKLLINNIKKSK